MQTCNPLTARQWFKLGEPVNWAASIAAFAILFFVLEWIIPALAAFGVALAAAFCLHFFYLDHRAIRIKCPYGRCGETIETNTPWICGHKGCRNDNPDDFPFIYKCEHCGYQPKAYKRVFRKPKCKSMDSLGKTRFSIYGHISEGRPNSNWCG